MGLRAGCQDPALPRPSATPPACLRVRGAAAPARRSRGNGSALGRFFLFFVLFDVEDIVAFDFRALSSKFIWMR